MANPYAPPRIDFSPLANLGETFFSAYDRGVKRRQDEETGGLLTRARDELERQQAPSATVPQTMPLAPLGQSASAYNEQGKAPTFAAMSGGRPSESLTGDKEAFTRAVMPYALEASKRTGVDPRIIVAQAALESAWGKSAPGNNFFGIKSHGQGGGQTLATTEVVNGQPMKVNDSFRTYGGLGDSVMGYADFINQNPRYAGLKNAKGVDEQIAALQASGYATDPQYGTKIASIVKGLPSADIPAPNAQDAQFQIPGQGGMPQVQAASGPQPVSRDLFNALAANPNTRAIAGQILSSRLNPQSAFDFQTVGDQLVRVNKRTGAAEVVPGIVKQSNQWSKLNDGTLFNQQTGETMAIQGGQAAGMFSGNSVDAQALNELVRTGQLTREQAAQFAAGKTVTGPNGEQLFLTPQGVFSAPAPNAAPPSGTAAASATPAPREGVIPLTTGKPEKPTEGQSNAALYARRMTEANEILSKPEVTAAMQSRMQSGIHKLPGGNSMVLKEFQLADQAKRNFINSVLRRESGAVISPEEFANADLQYFPQPGDSFEVIRQKEQNRQTAIEGITSAAGPAAPKQDGGWTDIGGVKIRRKQ